MVALNVVSRLRHTNDLRAYRRKLLNDIQQSPLVRQLPALLDVPLPIVGIDGTPRHLDDTLEQASFVLLAGTLGSGRLLALQQIAQHLLSAETKPTPVLISLAAVDDGRGAPIVLLGDALANLSQNRGTRKNGGQPTVIERLAGWALLFTELEELPQHRQTAWKAILQLAPQQWPQTQVIVAVSRDEARWTGYTTLTIAHGEQVADRWVDLLAPTEHRAMLAAILRPGAPLAPLATRLFDVALLALVARRGHLPNSRAELYDLALAELYDLDRDDDQGRTALENLQLLAAYDERPKILAASLLEPTGVGSLRFAPPLFGRYLAAHQLVDEQRFDLLAALPGSEQREIARFCATIAGDLLPLYIALWNNGKPSVDQLVTLGSCLRERPDSPTNWAVRIIGGLAVLARDDKPPHNGQALAVLRQCRVALDSMFATLVRGQVVSQRIVPQLVSLLPNDLATQYAETIAYNQAVASYLAWELADLLVQSPTNAAFGVAPSERIARTRWTYVQTLRGPESRAALSRTHDADIIRDLAFADLDDARLLRVAATLLEDTALPTDYRVAGVNLLAHNSQPTALTVIERACYDGDAVVRQAALARLASRDASRGQTALSRAALDHDAPSDTRIGAIERLAGNFAEESQPLLARCARDISLPLYAQLLSVAALNATALGPLADTVRQSQSHPDVRGLAAERIGTIGDTTYVPMLRALLDNTDAPTELMKGVCAGIGALGTSALEPLGRLLQRSAADVDLTVAAIAALGQIKSDTSAILLGELAGEAAWARLEHVVPSSLRDLPAEEALVHADLPAPLATNLAVALAHAATQAERPTVLREFLQAEVTRIRVAAAASLAQIGGNSARAALLAALLDDAAGGASDAVVGALARTGGGSAEALGHLLVEPEVNPMTRWMVTQHLRDHPQGEATMHRALGNLAIDSFSRGALAEALGQRKAIMAMPLLRQIADDREADAHVRSQAVVGLGLLDEPATEIALVRLLSNQNEDLALRSLAAEQLPTMLSAEGRRVLRELLRRERQPEQLTASIVRTLGRIHDQESLPLVLRFAQDESGEIARAALHALAEIGDASVAPVLVRVTQNQAADRTTRLAAIGSLLKLGGDGYRPLLRSYIEDGTLPLRLQALEHLISAGATNEDLATILNHTELPLAVRLQVLAECARRADCCDTLCALAADSNETIELRVRAIDALRNHSYAVAVPTLVGLAADGPDAVRLASIVALGTIGGTAACTTLGKLAEGASQPAPVRTTARAALRAAVQRMATNNQFLPELGHSDTYVSVAST